MNVHLSRPTIAVIGAGLTGVSAAAHCVGHVLLSWFLKQVGRRTWAGFGAFVHERFLRQNFYLLAGTQRMNNASGVQIHSNMYRFYPSVQWNRGYPDWKQIVSQITRLWKRYARNERTKLLTT